jgi:CheY-specific phosphatase CheX
MNNELPIEKLDAILELQRLNSLNMPYRNLSWTTITEIQNVIAAGLKKKLVVVLGYRFKLNLPHL